MMLTVEYSLHRDKRLSTVIYIPLSHKHLLELAWHGFIAAHSLSCDTFFKHLLQSCSFAPGTPFVTPSDLFHTSVKETFHVHLYKELLSKWQMTRLAGLSAQLKLLLNISYLYLIWVQWLFQRIHRLKESNDIVWSSVLPRGNRYRNLHNVLSSRGQTANKKATWTPEDWTSTCANTWSGWLVDVCFRPDVLDSNSALNLAQHWNKKMCWSLRQLDRMI